MTPQDRAKKAAERMMAQDAASRDLGMQITHIAPGRRR